MDQLDVLEHQAAILAIFLSHFRHRTNQAVACSPMRVEPWFAVDQRVSLWTSTTDLWVVRKI